MFKLPRHSVALKALRKALGLSQERFAWKLGITTRTVAAWESGRVIPPGTASSLRRTALSIGEQEIADVFEACIRERLEWIPDGLEGPQTDEEIALVAKVLKEHRARKRLLEMKPNDSSIAG